MSQKDSNTLTIPVGQTWQGFDFFKITKYKRKEGFKVEAVTKYWSGKFMTKARAQAKDAEEVIQAMSKMLLPIFEVPEEVKEKIKEFCRQFS